jgi:ClpP class serine protease
MAWLARALATGFSRSRPLVSIVTLRGQIAPPARGPRRVLNAARAAPWLDRAFGLKPDAVAVRVSSPGGSPAQTELLVEAVLRRARIANTPVYAFAEDVAASGGYWLLAAAGTAGAYALPTSVVGSVGVVAPSFGAVEAISRLGLERRVWSAGADKVGVDPFLPVTETQEARLTDLLQDLHGSFCDAVKKARGPALAKAAGLAPGAPLPADLFTGRVWTGTQAAALGLVDGLGTIHSVLSEKLGPKTVFVECGELPPGRGLFGAAASVPAAAVEEVVAAVDERVAAARLGVS